MTRDELLEFTKRKKKDKPEIVVDVYDVFKDIALAKVTNPAFVDYCQLAKIDGKWQVINVLWQQKDTYESSRQQIDLENIGWQEMTFEFTELIRFPNGHLLVSKFQSWIARFAG